MVVIDMELRRFDRILARPAPVPLVRECLLNLLPRNAQPISKLQRASRILDAWAAPSSATIAVRLIHRVFRQILLDRAPWAHLRSVHLRRVVLIVVRTLPTALQAFPSTAKPALPALSELIKMLLGVADLADPHDVDRHLPLASTPPPSYIGLPQSCNPPPGESQRSRRFRPSLSSSACLRSVLISGSGGDVSGFPLYRSAITVPYTRQSTWSS